MPPDDSLFNTPPPDEGNSPTPTVPSEPPALTAESVQAMIAEQTGPLQTQLAVAEERLAATQAANAELSSRYAGPAPVPTPEMTGDEYIEGFTNDALGATRGVAETVVNERVARLEPIFQRQNDTIHQGLVADERRAVEAEYGEGAWDTHFAPLMDARMVTLRQSDQLSLANPEVIHGEVLSIMGHKRNELAGVKAGIVTSAAEAESARYEQIRSELNMTGMTGGTNAPAPKLDAPLSATDQEYIQSKKLAGQDVNIQQLRKTINSGATSWSDWKAAQGDN